MAIRDWADATDPYEATRPLLRPDGAYGISDSAWALHVHVLGLQRTLPTTSYRSLTESLPIMRVVKDADELERLAAAGAAADAAYGVYAAYAAYGEIVKVRFTHAHFARGVACEEIDRAARALITEAGHGEAFIHRTWHGIGVTTHEPPYIVEGDEQGRAPGCASPSSQSGWMTRSPASRCGFAPFGPDPDDREVHLLVPEARRRPARSAATRLTSLVVDTRRGRGDPRPSSSGQHAVLSTRNERTGPHDQAARGQ